MEDATLRANLYMHRTHTYIHRYIHTCIQRAGAIYVEDATLRATGAVHFTSNRAVTAGGALLGSPRSVIDIRSTSVLFVNNAAATVMP